MHLIFGTDTIDSLSSGVKSLGASFKGYITKLKEAKFETVALKVETVALEAAMTLGITLAISALVSGVNKLIHAEEQAAEEERKFWQTIDDNVDKLEQEEIAIDDLIAKYSDLTLNSKNDASAREDLSKLQDQMIKDYGSEADAIDLVNGKYSEQIKTLQDLKKEKSEAFIYDEDNIKAYEEALSKLSDVGDINGKLDIQFKDLGARSGNPFSEDILKQWKESGLIDEYQKMVGYGNEIRYGFELTNQDALTVYQTLEQMAESYKELSTEAGNFNEKQYTALKQQAEEAEKFYNKYKSFVDLYEKNKSVAEFTLPEETQKQFDELIDKAKVLYEEISGDSSPEQKFIATEKLRELKNELYEISSGNTDLTSAVDDLFNSIDNGTSLALEDFSNLREIWLNTLDDMQKGALKNISTMVSALQDLSEGKGIAANTFWSLIEFDEEGLLNGAKLVGDKFVIAEEKMIELKDKYIQKQIDEINNRQSTAQLQKDAYDKDVAFYELEVAKLALQKKSVASDEYRTALSNLEKAKASAKEWGDEIERNNWLIQYLNQTLGNTVDLQKQLEAQQKQLNKELTALEKELDNYQKAHEAKIDGIIKGLEAEGNALENQKEALEDELDVLEKQKDSIDDIISKYDTVNSLVQKTIEQDIKKLEDERDAIKDNYDARIKALQDENKEREDSLEYAQKLKNLENAKNNKVRVYDEARGWHYATNQDEVKKAQNDLSSFETRKAIESLEAQRDALIDSTEDIINTKKAYAEQFKNLADIIQTEADEELAAELLGADWREKIANGDVDLLEKFSEEYRKHNGDLKRLTDTEIKYKKEQIDAKKKEIDANKQRITTWRDLKNTISTAVTDIKNANADYTREMGNIQLNEKSTLEERGNVVENFKNRVTGYVDQIAAKKADIDAVTQSLDSLNDKSFTIDAEVKGLDDIDKAIAKTAELYNVTMAQAWANYLLAHTGEMTQEEREHAQRQYAHYSTNGYNPDGFAQGGVVDYTGIAMVHGTKQKSETVFNANDSAKLYEMVHNTPNLMADMLNQAKTIAGRTGSVAPSVSIGAISVYANNPQEFTRGLDKQLDRYFKTKLTQSYTQ